MFMINANELIQQVHQVRGTIGTTNYKRFSRLPFLSKSRHTRSPIVLALFVHLYDNFAENLLNGEQKEHNRNVLKVL